MKIQSKELPTKKFVWAINRDEVAQILICNEQKTSNIFFVFPKFIGVIWTKTFTYKKIALDWEAISKNRAICKT